MTYPSSLRITATCSPEQASDELLATILAAVGFEMEMNSPHRDSGEATEAVK